jgi:uncharacterized membrane protein YkvA (DUF1232 family)
MAALKAKQRMKGLLMFLPAMLALCFRLMTDPRVPRVERALVLGAIVYALIPLDFIPDMLPFVGQIDDVYLISLTVLRLIDRTDEAVVREHWRGGGDVIQLAQSVASVAPLILPQRIRRVLSSKVEVVPKGKRMSLESFANGGKGGKQTLGAMLVELPEDEEESAPKR